jgi:hypothetical protein
MVAAILFGLMMATAFVLPAYLAQHQNHDESVRLCKGLNSLRRDLREYVSKSPSFIVPPDFQPTRNEIILLQLAAQIGEQQKRDFVRKFRPVNCS